MYRTTINGETVRADHGWIAMETAGVRRLPAKAYRRLLKWEAPRTPIYDGLRDRIVDRAVADGRAAALPANDRIRGFVREYGVVDYDDEQGLAGRLPARWGRECSLCIYVYAAGDLICLMGKRRNDRTIPSMIVTGSHHGLTGHCDGEPPLPVYIGQLIERMRTAPRATLDPRRPL